MFLFKLFIHLKKYFSLIKAKHNSWLILVLVLIVSCESKQNTPIHKDYEKNIVINLFDKSLLENAKDLKSSKNVKKFTDFKIVYFDKDSKKIYLRIASEPDKYYYTNCTIDSAFNFNLLNNDSLEIIYRGKFNFISEEYGDFTFFAVNTYDSDKKVYKNLFNDYFILDNSSILQFEELSNYIQLNDGRVVFNGLEVSYKEGTGNYLDFKIYGFNGKNFDEIYEPNTPIESGELHQDSCFVYLLEGLQVKKISYFDGKQEVQQLNDTPVFDYVEGDDTLELKVSNGRKIEFPKFLIVNSECKLHIVQIGRIENEDEFIRFSFDDNFWSQNFNQLIPKIKGSTSINFEKFNGEFIRKIKVFIN